MLKKYASIALYHLKLTVQRQLEYPLFLISWLLLIPLEAFSFVFLLNIITQNFQILMGWTFGQMVYLYGLGLISQGIMVVFFIQTYSIGDMVINGTFDRLLLRPVDVFFQFIASNVNLIGIFDILCGISIFIYGCVYVDFVITFVNIAEIVLVILGATLLRSAVYTAIGSLSFWFKSRGTLIGITEGIVENVTFYPLSIYPKVVQMIFTYLFPVGFICFYPASDFLSIESGSVLPFNSALLTPLIGAFLFFLSQVIMRRGLKRYESSGS